MDLLASGPERPPRRLPRPQAALLLAALTVAAAGAWAVPVVQADVRTAQAPPVVTATTSGGSVLGGRLRVWLLLEGPPRARLAGVEPRLQGSEVRAVAPESFSRRGYAVVRLDVDPSCPAAVAGLAGADLAVRVDDDRPAGARTVRVPLDTSGLLEATVRDRCSGRGGDAPLRGPLLRAGEDPAPGVLRTVVELGAPGPEILVVKGVTPGPGLSVSVVTPLPLRVPVGRQGELVVDLRPGRCAADPEAPPFTLEHAADGDVEPVVDAGLRGRLLALRRGACRAG